jgi:polar amino acid transport system substrate-binding protein
MTQLSRRTVARLALAAPASLLLGRTGRAQGAGGLAKLRNDGARIGFANEFPFSVRNPDGSVGGVEFDIARAVLEQLGVRRIEPVATEFRGLIPGLQAGRFDLLAAGLYVQPARCEQVLFSEPNIRTEWTVLVPKGNPHRVGAFEDIARHNLRLASIQGTAAARSAMAAGVREAQMVLFPAFPEALAALRAGRVDAMTTSSVTAGDYTRGEAGNAIERASPWRVTVVDGKPQVSYTAFAFRKDDVDLRAAFATAHAAFMASPRRAEVFAKYGLTDAEWPRQVAVDALCRA